MVLAQRAAALLALLGAARAETIAVENWVRRSDYTPMTATVGDTAVFTWSGGHNVYLHLSGDCDNAGAVGVGDTPSTSGASYTFTEAGDFTFACDVSSHCSAGQIVTFTVSAAEAESGGGGGGGGGGDGGGGGVSCSDTTCPAATDACHIAGTCSGGAGSGMGTPAACSDETVAPDGTACGGSNVCTAGVCGPLPTKASGAPLTTVAAAGLALLVAAAAA
jgi:plastocyanin